MKKFSTATILAIFIALLLAGCGGISGEYTPFGVVTFGKDANGNPATILKPGSGLCASTEGKYTQDGVDLIVPAGMAIVATDTVTLTVAGIGPATKTEVQGSFEVGECPILEKPAQANEGAETATEEATAEPTEEVTPEATPSPESSADADMNNGVPVNKAPKILGSKTIDGNNAWDNENPYPDALTATVAKCQYEKGKYDPQGQERWFNLTIEKGYQRMVQTCLTGGVWYKDSVVPGVTFVYALGNSPADQNDNSVQNDAVTDDCGDLAATRNERLHAGTDAYKANGRGLKGFTATLKSFNVTYQKLAFGYSEDAWQPDTELIDNVETLWGGVVRTRGMSVTCDTVFVTDVPSRVASSTWYVKDMRYDPPVYHFGGAKTPDNKDVDIAVHLSAINWVEVVMAYECQCNVIINDDGTFGPEDDQ